MLSIKLQAFVQLQDQWHAGQMACVHGALTDEERQMIGTTKAIRIFAVAVTILSLVQPASAQGLGKKGGREPPPTENKPKIDEKAYKAALERIPEPKKKYDPWGIARPGEPADAGKKAN